MRRRETVQQHTPLISVLLMWDKLTLSQYFNSLDVSVSLASFPIITLVHLILVRNVNAMLDVYMAKPRIAIQIYNVSDLCWVIL